MALAWQQVNLATCRPTRIIGQRGKSAMAPIGCIYLVMLMFNCLGATHGKIH